MASQAEEKKKSVRKHRHHKKTHHHVHHHYHGDTESVEKRVIVETTRIVAEPEILDKLSSLLVDEDGKMNIKLLQERLSLLQTKQHHRTRKRCRRKHRSSHGTPMEEESVVERHTVLSAPEGLEASVGTSPAASQHAEVMSPTETGLSFENIQAPVHDSFESGELTAQSPIPHSSSTDLSMDAVEPDLMSLLKATRLLKYASRFAESGIHSIEAAKDLSIGKIRSLGVAPRDADTIHKKLSLHLAQEADSLEPSPEISPAKPVKKVSKQLFMLLRANGLDSVAAYFAKHGAATVEDASKLTDTQLQDICFKTPENINSFRSVVQEALNKKVGAAATEVKRKLEPGLMEVLNEYNFNTLETTFLELGALSLQDAIDLDDAEYTKMGFNTNEKIQKFKRTLAIFMESDSEESDAQPEAQPDSQEDEESDQDGNNELGESKVGEGDAQLEKDFLKLLQDYKFEQLVPEFVRLGATTLVKASELSDSVYSELGFNTEEKVARFKRSLLIYMESDDEESDQDADNELGESKVGEGDAQLEKDFLKLLQDYKFEQLVPEFVRLGATTLVKASELSDSVYSELGFNTEEKVARFKRSLLIYMESDDEEEDEEVEAESKTQQLEQPFQDLLEAYGFEDLAANFIELKAFTLHEAHALDTEHYNAMGFNTDEKVAKFKRALLKFAESSDSEPEDDDDAPEPKEDNTEESQQAETEEKPEAEASIEEREEPIVAAPWELPSIQGNVMLTKKRDKLLRDRAKEISDSGLLWKSENKRLLKPPPRTFKFSLPMVARHASIAMELHPALMEARFKMIPSQLSERDFWGVYFWEVEVLKATVVEEIGAKDMPLAPPAKNKTYTALARSPMIQKAIAAELEKRATSDDALEEEPTSQTETTQDAVPEEDSAEDESSGEEISDEEVSGHSGDEEEIVAKEFAAPWEMPPLGTARINKKRDEMVKARVLQLSESRSIWACTPEGNLLNPPPIDFKFSVNMAMPHISVGLEQDEFLRAARFTLVPTTLSEKDFWSAYFWEVEQIKLQVTDDIQTSEHDELLAQMVFTRSESVEADRRIYESSTASSLVRGVVVREHVRRKMQKHNELHEKEEAESNGNKKKLLKRVSFSFDPEDDSESTLQPAVAQVGDVLSQSVESAVTDTVSAEDSANPVKDESVEHDAGERDRTDTIEIESSVVVDKEATTPDASFEEPEPQPYESSSDDNPEEGTTTSGSADDSDSDTTDKADSDTLQQNTVETNTIQDSAQAKDGLENSSDRLLIPGEEDQVDVELSQLKRSTIELLKFFIPPVLLIPIVIVLRLFSKILFSTKSVTFNAGFMVGRGAFKLLKKVISIQLVLLQHTLSFVKFCGMCTIRGATVIVFTVVKGIKGVTKFHTVMLRRTLRGFSLIFLRLRTAVKIFLLKLLKFSLQPVAYIVYFTKLIVFLPWRIGSRIIRKSRNTADHIKKNKRDTADMIIALIGLAIIFLVSTGVLFPFVHDFIASRRAPFWVRWTEKVAPVAAPKTSSLLDDIQEKVKALSFF